MDKISFDFKGRTAIVTGGAQGFGLDIAKRLIMLVLLVQQQLYGNMILRCGKRLLI